MGRNAEIEKIIEAWYESNNCSPTDRARQKLIFDRLVDAAVSKANGLCNRQQLLNSLWPRYQEYRKEKFKAQGIQVAQSAMKQS
jgi:hypothetical protein